MNTLFNWNSQDYSVWVQAMDDEHIQLIKIMNKLYERHEAKANRTELGDILRDLINYTQKHFTDEERYLDSINFPEAKIHKVIHVQLMDKLKGFSEAFNKGQPLTKEFFDFLKGWLSAHIRGIDRKYGEFAKTHSNK